MYPLPHHLMKYFDYDSRVQDVRSTHRSLQADGCSETRSRDSQEVEEGLCNPSSAHQLLLLHISRYHCLQCHMPCLSFHYPILRVIILSNFKYLPLLGNDDRYVSNVLDVRYSVFESLIRSIEHRKLELHRKFPKTESLKVFITFYTHASLSTIIRGKTRHEYVLHCASLC
jgi:hypothetical protein